MRIRTKEHYVEHKGIRLWVETFGLPESPACLLISGAGAISSFWPDDLCHKLADEGYFVIRYDNRDAGYSSFVDFQTSPYSLDDLTDDAICVLNTLGVKQAHVAGSSMGGFVAQLLAIHHPERIMTMTSFSSHTGAPDVPTPHESTWEVLLANRPQGKFETDLAGYMKVWKFLNGHIPFDESKAESYTRELYKRNPATLPAHNHVAAQANAKDRTSGLNALRIPSMVIHGQCDPLVPLEAGLMTAKAIPGCECEVLPKAGHMFFNQHVWERIADLLSKHFARHKA